jgi:predicted anti-sigma-YlaC factor YlaD
MSDEMRKQLGAYLDCELSSSLRQAVQAHLNTCPDCREELDTLRQLSKTLRSAPLPAGLPSADRFVDQLAPRLPARSVNRTAIPASRAGWLIPLGLLAMLIFIQATGVLSTLVTLASGSGQLGQIGTWFAAGSGQTLWFSAAQTTLQNVLSMNAFSNLQVTNDIVVGLQQWLLSPLLWQVIVTVAYVAGLAIWLSGRQASSRNQQILE